jgi:single-stranded-DNA-specific exonuclease
MLVKAKMPHLRAAIVATRNFSISSIDDLRKYIKCDINDLEHPNKVPGVKELAETSITQIMKPTVIFGDYDVDGLMSTFLLKKLLRDIGVKDVSIYTPDRKTDGYGLNSNSVKNFISKFGKVKLGNIYLLDCGTNSKKEIAILRKHFDANIVIIDHHIVEPKAFSDNADIVINPRIGDSTKTGYCTGGLMYQIVSAFSKKVKDNRAIKTEEYIGYAGIATIADVADLDYNNRIIVANGLKNIKNCKEKGFKSLLNTANVDSESCSTRDISFGIAPRINANGRIKHAEIVSDLLFSTDPEEIEDLVAEIEQNNVNRKEIQKGITEEVLTQLEGFDRDSVLIYNEDWNPGVVGIVASRVVETFNVPSIVFGGADGKIKGSARSIDNINVKEIMDKIEHVFAVYGGHEMAAGATLKQEYADTAWDLFDEAVKEYKKENGIKGVNVYYDLELDKNSLKKIDDKFCDNIEKLGPFGSGNESLVFRANNVKCQKVYEWRSGSGGFAKIQGIGIDCFVYGQNMKEQMEGKTMDILFELSENFKDDANWAVTVKDFVVRS